MDQDLCRYESVWAAAGTDSAFFQIAPRTLRMLSNAVVAQVAKEFRRSAAGRAPDPTATPVRGRDGRVGPLLEAIAARGLTSG